MKTEKEMKEKWEISDALETLQKAEEIRANRALMAKVAKAAARIQKVVTMPKTKINVGRKKGK